MRRRAKWAEPAQPPRLREVMRDFEFHSPGEVGPRLLSQFRGSENLLLLVGDAPWIGSLAAHGTKFAGLGIRLLVLTSKMTPSPVFLALTGGGAAAAYLTDRYGEIIYLWRENDGRSRPSWQDLLGWAEYLEARCDECFPSEWPD